MADLLERAIAKRRAGEELTAREAATLNRAATEREETLRWQHYQAIPQKHWVQMSGRQAKVIREQAVRYGIPFGSATIDLAAVVRSLHDFLAANARRLLTAEGDDADEARAEAERRRAIAQAGLEELKLARARGELIDCDEAERQRLEVLQWSVGTMERAAAELPIRLAGKTPGQIGGEITKYFNEVRRAAARQR